MHLQHQQLTAIAAERLLDGFDLEITPHETNLIGGQPLAEHFANHHYEITAECDGSNQHYPDPSTLRILLTSYVDETSNIGIAPNGDVGIIILKPYESLALGRICEVRQANVSIAVLLLMIRNNQDTSVTTLAYALAHSNKYYN